MNNVFLIGSERSGTNLFCKMLNEHESICAPSPIHALRLFNQSMPNFGDLKNESNLKHWLQSCVDYLNAKLGYWKTTITLQELLDNQIYNGTDLYNYVCKKELEYSSKTTFVAKENKLFIIKNSVYKEYPKAKFLYLVRDPRAFVLSFMQSSNHPGGLEEAVNLWKQEQEQYLEMKKELGDAVLLLKYEDLIVSSKKTMTLVYDFLELPFSDSYTNFYQAQNTKLEASRLNNWNNLAGKINQNRLQAYLDYFDQNTISYIETSLNKFMDIFNYESKLSEVNSKLKTMSYSTLGQSEKNLRNLRLKAIKHLLKEHK